MLLQAGVISGFCHLHVVPVKGTRRYRCSADSLPDVLICWRCCGGQIFSSRPLEGVDLVDQQEADAGLGDCAGHIQLARIADKLHAVRHRQRHQYKADPQLVLRSRIVQYTLTEVPRSHQANQAVKHTLIL